MSAEKLRTDKTCLNCGHHVENTYCSCCGQKNVELHDSFFHLATHFITDYFHFDSKLRRSVVPLLFKPGHLPKLYLKGERTSHINPVGTLIFFSAVFFILFRSVPLDINVSRGKPQKSGIHVGGLPSRPTSEDSAYQAQAIDQFKNRIGDTLQLASGQTASMYKKNAIGKLKAVIGGDEVQTEMLKEKFMHNFAKIVLVLIPLLAAILWLVYYRKKMLFFWHLILVTYVHCFMYLLLIIAAIFALANIYLYQVAFLAIAVYIIFAMKNFYGQGWIKTIFKFFTVAFFYLLFFAIGLGIDILITLM